MAKSWISLIRSLESERRKLGYSYAYIAQNSRLTAAGVRKILLAKSRGSLESVSLIASVLGKKICLFDK